MLMLQQTQSHKSRFACQLFQCGNQHLSLTFLGGRFTLSANCPQLLLRSHDAVTPLHPHDLNARKIAGMVATDVGKK